MGAKLEHKLGLGHYGSFNETGPGRTILRLAAISITCLITMAVGSKLTKLVFKIAGLPEEVDFILRRTVVMMQLNLFCFGFTKLICYKLGLGNTEKNKVSTKKDKKNKSKFQ